MLTAGRRLYLDAFRGLSRHTWYLTLVMLINRSGTMAVPFMTIYCTQQLHFTLTQAGVVMGLFGFGSIVGSLIGGRITDRFGFYSQQIAALLSGGVMFIVTGYLHTYLSLCIGAFVLNVCNDSFRPANATAIAFYSEPETRTRSYSLNRLAVNLGWAVGGALGGFLASVNYHLLFWVDGCTNIVAAFLLLRLLPYQTSGTRHETTVQAKLASSAYRDRIYLVFIVLTILMGYCFFHLFTILPVFYKTQWQLSEPFIGWLMAINGLIIVAIEMILVFSLEGRRPLMTYIRFGVFLMGVSFAVINLLPAGAAAAIIAVIIITLGEILSMPFMNSFWVSRTSHSNRGQYAAMYSAAWSIAQIAAPVIGTELVVKYGYPAVWWLLAGLCTASAAGFSLLGKKVADKAAGEVSI